MTTLVSQYPMAECIGVAVGSTVIVYYDKDGDGRVAPNEFVTVGPPDQPFRFKDAIAKWDGVKFVAATSGSGVYTKADLDAAERKGYERCKADVARLKP